MTFREYLKTRGLNINSYAKLIGVSASYLYEVDRGEKLPGYELCFKIEVETGGKFPMRHWGDKSGLDKTVAAELKGTKTK